MLLPRHLGGTDSTAVFTASMIGSSWLVSAASAARTASPTNEREWHDKGETMKRLTRGVLATTLAVGMAAAGVVPATAADKQWSRSRRTPRSNWS